MLTAMPQLRSPLVALRAWALSLLRAEPVPVGCLMLFVVFPISMTTPWSVATPAGADSCLVAYSAGLAEGNGIDPRPINYATAGMAAGCVIYSIAVASVSRIHRHPRIVLRLGTIWTVAAMLLETFIYYVLLCNGKLLRVCVTQLGGWSGEQRVVIPAHYLFWMCTNTMLAMMGKLAGASRRLVQLTLIANVGTMLFGLAAALVDSSFVAWSCMLIVALLCCGFVTFAITQFLRGAYAAACDDMTRRLLRVLGPLAVLIWVAYPAFWLVCAFGWVSMQTEQSIWPVMDLLSKVIFSLHMTVGDFSLAATEGEALLQTIDDARHAAVLANDAKRDVVRYLFHEIRVPLNSIVLAVEDLSSITPPQAASLTSPTHAASAPERDRKEILGILSASAADMTHLLDSFLSLEKVESGRMELELEETHVTEKLQRTITTFTAALAHRALHVTLTVDPDVPAHVVMDPNRIRQCISNFLSNAIKFSPFGSTIAIRAELVAAALGEGTLSSTTAASILHTLDPTSTAVRFLPSAAAVVRAGFSVLRRKGGKRSAAIAPSRLTDDSSMSFASAESRASQSSSADIDATAVVITTSSAGRAVLPDPPACAQFLRISVTDFGIGISAEDQAKLFTTFVQIRPGQHQGAGGSGLGLAICRRIVELHGGRVGVRSVEGSYSCFFMDLPTNLAPLQRTSVHTHLQIEHSGPTSHDPAPGAGAGLAASFPTVIPMISSADPRVLMDPRFPPLSLNIHLPPPAAGGATHAVAGRNDTPDNETTPLAANAEGGGEGAGAVPASVQSPLLLQLPVATPTPSARGPLATTGLLQQLTTAMVIDDVASNRLLLARLLRRRGVESVASVDGGKAALAAWRGMDALSKAALQCVFSDKEMPGDLDGHDTVRALRAEGYTGAIVGVTGNALEGDRAAFVAAGADCVLTKPVSSERLERVLLAVGLSLAGGTLPNVV